jgi:hypothetical protein
MNKGINDELINNELINELDAYPLMILFCYMIEDDDPTMLVRNIILLVRNKRFDLLKKVIENNNLENIKYATNEELMSDEEEFLNLLETKKANLLKIEEVA